MVKRHLYPAGVIGAGDLRGRPGLGAYAFGDRRPVAGRNG